MGANQSYEGEITHEGCKGAHSSKHYKQEQQTRTGADKLHKNADGVGKKHKAKPGPPHKPKVSEVTHNSITVSWQPPRYNLHSPSNGATVIAYTVEMTQLSTGNGKTHSNHGKLHQGHWVTLTKVCQASSYSAKDLSPDSTYAFRVRAENVHGVGKPSAPSEPTTTHMFESTADSLSLASVPAGSPNSSCPLERSYAPSSPTSLSPADGQGSVGAPRLRRRHSFNVHLDGGAVTKIVNHSDVVLTNHDSSNNPSAMSHSHSCHASISPPNSTTSSSSMSTLSPSSAMSSGFNFNHRYSERRKASSASSGDRSPRLYERSHNTSHPSASVTSLCRKNSYNTSSQGRKISLPILLPGTGTDSLTRMRESRSSLRSNVSDVQAGEGQGHGASGSHEIMVVTVGRSSNSKSARRLSNGSVGSGTTTNSNGSSSNNSRKGSGNKDRLSRTSIGSGGSEVTSSRMSLDDSIPLDASRGIRTSLASSESSSAAVVSSSSGERECGGRCGSYPSLSGRSSRSDATLSNSKDGSKDSLCDLGSSNRSTSSVGEDMVDSGESRGLDNNFRPLNEYDDEKLRSFTNYNNVKDIDMKDGSEKILSENRTKQIDLENCDDIYKLKEELKNFEFTEENLRFHDMGHNFVHHKNHHNVHHVDPQHDTNGSLEKGSYYASLENPWEKEASTNGLSERILAAPVCDDIKMALYARDMSDTSAPGFPLTNADTSSHTTGDLDSYEPQADFSTSVYGGAGDFRTLRSVLQSSSMFVKAQRFSPDVVGVVVGEGGDTCRTLTRARLTTIADADEDEDAVRITTL
ncbi:myosin light chain kinase, smooth muscle [Plakobranchus ocellatus]|uniref:Myosin light chain kinase, smooth muscle n=1 Tax=Plakobranchus ocellatus TaxID=259542 RepID=A0AAV4D306_9GAST|nr:myosin light chain kinase, smooth muscle [Plakobranchus ocellatus]